MASEIDRKYNVHELRRRMNTSFLSEHEVEMCVAFSVDFMGLVDGLALRLRRGFTKTHVYVTKNNNNNNYWNKNAMESGWEGMICEKHVRVKWNRCEVQRMLNFDESAFNVLGWLIEGAGDKIVYNNLFPK